MHYASTVLSIGYNPIGKAVVPLKLIAHKIVTISIKETLWNDETEPLDLITYI
jgi:hypothetical protein